FYILKSCILKILQRPYHLPAVWVTFWIEVLVNYILGMTVRPVINSLSFFIFYNLFFLGKNRVCNRIDKIAKFICFCPDHFFHSVIWYCLEIIGPVAAGRPVCTGTSNSCAKFIKTTGAKVFRF